MSRSKMFGFSLRFCYIFLEVFCFNFLFFSGHTFSHWVFNGDPLMYIDSLDSWGSRDEALRRGVLSHRCTEVTIIASEKRHCIGR